MSEGGNAVLRLPVLMHLLGPLIRDAGVLQRLTGMFLSGEVLLLSAMFGGAPMRMRSRFMQLGGLLAVSQWDPLLNRLDMSNAPHLPGLRVGVLGKFVSMVRVLHGPVGMPASRSMVALFIVLSGSAMRLGCIFVHLRGFPVKFVFRFSVL